MICTLGVDDAEALLLLLARDDIEVLAISCVSGNAPLANTVQNACRVLELCHRSDIPVFAGSAQPLLEPIRHASYYHGDDGFGGYSVGRPPPSIDADRSQHAVTALIQLCRQHCRPAVAGELHERRVRLTAALETLRQQCRIAVETHAMEKLPSLAQHVAQVQ